MSERHKPESIESLRHVDPALLTPRQVYELIVYENPKMPPREKYELAMRLGLKVVRKSAAASQATQAGSPAAPSHPEDTALTAIMDVVMEAPAPPADGTPLPPSGNTGNIDLGETRPVDEEPVESTTSLIRRISGMSHGQKLMVVGAAAIGLAVTGTVVAKTGGTASNEAAACADATHQLRMPGQDMAGLAADMENDRNYHIDPARLARNNATVRDIDANVVRKLPDNVDGASEVLKNDDHRYCFVVPAPIALGQEEADGHITLQQISLNVGQSAATLRELNADRLPKTDTEPIPAGTILWLSKDINLQLIMRPYHGESLHTLIGNDNDAIQALADANIFRFNEQDAINFIKDEDYYLPYTDAATTPAMKQLGITPADILKAYGKQLNYTTRNEPIPAAQPKPTTPEKPVATGHITDQQRELINKLDVGSDDRATEAERRQFIVTIVDALMQQQGYANEKHINMTVLLAQALLESDYGASEKAKLFNNYFGMKARAGDGWTGQDTGDKYPEGKYRVYASLEDCIKGYMDNIASKAWYDDARNSYTDFNAYLAGLLNEGDGQYSYAEDSDYQGKILNIIATYDLDNLLKIGMVSAPVATTPAPSSPEQQNAAPGNIKLDPSKYRNNARQSELPPNNSRTGQNADGTKYTYDPNQHQGPWLVYKNKLVLSSDLTYDQRLEMIQDALNGVHPTVDGLNNFKIVDVRAQVAADPGLKNFHGTSEDPEAPNVRQDVKFFVWHFTATNTSATGYEGFKAAWAMQNGGRHVGIQYYQDNKGNVYHLTDKFTYQVLNASGVVYNHVSFGMEIAACEQGAISSSQYTDGIYTTAQFLIYNKFIEKGVPITPIINKMVKGHHELNPDGHDDNPGIVMDQVRMLLINLLVQAGYTA